ncbi:hypothetical protein [Methylocystis rosea]|uniref:hypothetical protein n=1 Tax=Methylocystis rosea TaxID=173366 RepID=UPI001FD93CCC|nr:hypothetical protein [Methylocystis rosea]
MGESPLDRRQSGEDLKRATLYTSGEPCPMCISAIVWCGMGASFMPLQLNNCRKSSVRS